MSCCFRFKTDQLALSFDDVLIVPLDRLRFLQPSPHNSLLDFGQVAVEDGRIFELLADYFEPRLAKVRAAPEHQSDAQLLLTVSNDWIAIQEPDRMRVPNLAFRFGQASVDFVGKYIANVLVARFHRLIVFRDRWVHTIFPLLNRAEARP